MTPDDMALLAQMVRERSGFVLAADKAYLVETRLAPLARQEGFESLEQLLQVLRSGPDERLAGAVTDALADNETFFFRDKTAFEAFTTQVLPALAGSRSTLRVWSAACSTGQEPYSLAMLMDELAHGYPKLKLDLCASDISERCLSKAQAGVYSTFEVQRGLSIGRLLRHFEPVEEAWRLRPALRQSVRWRRFNLLDDPTPLGRFDVVFCRNVLTRFDAPTKKRVLEQIARVTAPDGYLFLDSTETISGVTEAFTSVADECGLYRPDPQFREAA